MTETAPPNSPRSAFVSVIAWLGIISGASGALVFLALLVLNPAMSSTVGFLSAVAGLVTSYGLWKRREWARQGFILVLAYSSVMGLWEALRFRVPRISELEAAAGQQLAVSQAQVDALASTLRAFALVLSTLVALFNVLIIIKLRTKRVRDEFTSGPTA
ncbi:MAG TPA: hypothetical protein VMH88_05980 [Gemmatimonadales bacterium]|nr:hypothetical protein [Gemmatimonadales bacterium]